MILLYCISHHHIVNISINVLPSDVVLGFSPWFSLRNQISVPRPGIEVCVLVNIAGVTK